MSCHACEQQHELKEATKLLLRGGEGREKCDGAVPVYCQAMAAGASPWPLFCSLPCP